MKIFNLITMAAIASVLSMGVAQAQIREQQPAEFPPASYKGKQYVDSTGCVFIRAGIDGDVSWVPRVTRSRKTVCGFAPSLAGQQIAAAVPAPAPAKVEQITVAPAVAAAPVAAAAAKPKRVKRVAAKPRRVAAPKVVRQVAPKPVDRIAATKPVVVAQAPAPQSAARFVTACPGASAISQRYLRGNGRTAVRCGPQAERIVGTRRVARIATQSGVAAAANPLVTRPIVHRLTTTDLVSNRVVATGPAVSVSAQTRVVPKHVAINRVDTRNVTVPRGYKPAWTDDRLNPYRAEQTLGGRQQMLLVWTNTVPRRLINRATGKDVTATVPLVYPYLIIDDQRRELGEVTIVQRNGQLVKRILRNPGQRTPVYSTRSAPKVPAVPTPKARVAAPAPAKAAPAKAAGKQYVQIGLFTTRAKADKAAQHLAGMGMGARIGKLRKGGKTYMAVQAGPFAAGNAAQSALSRLRGVGYSGAVARN